MVARPNLELEAGTLGTPENEGLNDLWAAEVLRSLVPSASHPFHA